MKLVKILAVGALALAVSSAASAATLKITGSTAFRKSLYAAIINQGYNQAAYVGANLSGANQAIFFNGTDYIECCMAGSVGGVKWVAAATPENARTSPTAPDTKAWLKVDGSIVLSAATIGAAPSFTIGGGTQEAASQALVAAGDWDAAAPAQVTMSDSFQKSTPYTTGAGYNNMADSQTGVGIVTFTFAKGQKHPDIDTINGGANAGGYERLTNISAIAFQNLAANGSAPLEMFTGNPADRNVDVILTGRDNDSGTRLATTFETGIGSVDKFLYQYQFFGGATDAGSATGVTIDSLTAFDLINGLGGYAGGGSVKNVLLNSIASGTVDGNGRPFIIVGYVGLGDTPGASLQLSYEGVPYSSEAVYYGQYSFWTREHLYYRTGATGLTGALKTLADALAAKIKTAPGTASSAGLLLAPLKVTRSAEGAVINPIY